MVCMLIAIFINLLIFLAHKFRLCSVFCGIFQADFKVELKTIIIHLNKTGDPYMDISQIGHQTILLWPLLTTQY